MNHSPKHPSLRRPGLLLPILFLLAAIAGCASMSRWWNPTTGYEAVGTPEVDFDTARARCEKEAEFRSASGDTQVDWNAFERCMQPLGWSRP